MCKRTPFEFFLAAELAMVSLSWKKGKSTRPDGVSFEAVRGIFAEGECWMDKMADMYSDALYKGHLPNTSDSVTTLLAKKLLPSSWGETRPITSSCTSLKILAQLPLARGRMDLIDPLGMQWSEQGKQTGEVIFALRRVSRMALDLGKTGLRPQTGHP